MENQPLRPAIALIGALILIAATAPAQNMSDMGAMDRIATHDSHLGHAGMKNMALHMTWSDPRRPNEADQARAAKLVATLRSALAKYKDYRAAERDGYKPFHPEFKRQAMVHFTNWWYAIKARFAFDPAEPTSLLYKRSAKGGYELIGAMYTAPRRWSEDRLNERVPLSVARWHQHVNLCFPQKDAAPMTVDWSKFGPNGAIATKQACDAAGGRFFPTLFGGWFTSIPGTATSASCGRTD